MSYTLHSLSLSEEEEKEREVFLILLFDWFTAPVSFRVFEIEGDSSHRYAEGKQNSNYRRRDNDFRERRRDKASDN